ncbi:MAG TPA: DUF1761 domain-containing protein [Candidatus Baltobacteraceae bacterium]|nr:DUF1761 domain-containing protein [Candidatus Baltobacteraceae bacterium]
MRVNWAAVIVSAIVFFLFGWLWYDMLFKTVWSASITATSVHALSMGGAPAYQLIVAVVMAFFLAYGVARILQWRGRVGPLEGAWIGFAFGLLIFGSMTWLSYAYSGWGPTLGFINVGYVAIGMAIQGAILSAWPQQGT